MTRAVAKEDLESIDVEYIDKDGEVRPARVHCKVIEFEDAVPLRKEGVETDTDSEFLNSVNRGTGLVVAPPYNLKLLAKLTELSTELHPNIEARVTNVCGFGYQLKTFPMTEDELVKYANEIQEERWRLEEFFDTIHPTLSLNDIRARVLYDKHSTGNGYLELIHDQDDNLIAVSHIKSQFIYMLERDETPSFIKVPYIRRKDFKVDYKLHRYRFRRYVLESYAGGAIYFKEAGDKRQLHKKTGEYAKAGEIIPFEDRATSLLHSLVYNPNSVYGVPHWIGASVAIAGSREAEEINYNSISNNMVPSMFIIVENGALTAASAQRLRQYVEKRATSNKNRSSMIILEGESLNEGGLDSGKFNIKIEPVSTSQQNDELYQQYDKNNSERVRGMMRHSVIFLGKGENINKSTATVLKQTTDEQVFAPERTKEDAKFNRFIMMAGLQSRFHYFESNHPNITDDTILASVMETAERSGGMTPRRADTILKDIFGGRHLGPLPQTIDLDKPYSLTFAEAQKYDNSGKQSPEDNANRGKPPKPDMGRDDE